MSWFWKSKQKAPNNPDLLSSSLYNEDTFYNQFVNDLFEARKEVIIESPYITQKRLQMLKPTFEKLVNKGVQVFILTRDPQEHSTGMAGQSGTGICYFESLGLQVLLIKGGHHRKLAIIDRTIAWEGSLNILSQAHSREFMRRIVSKKLTKDLFQFLRFDTIDIFRENLDLI